MKKTAIIVDLDGTLCNTDHRQHYVAGEYKKKDFDKFYQNLHLDPPHDWCVELVHMYMERGYRIVFCSGRPDEYRELTAAWIEKHAKVLPGDYDLYMRETGNYEKDTSLKERIYRENIEPKYKVAFAIDDRKSVVEMWRKIGLVCLQCAPGDF